MSQVLQQARRRRFAIWLSPRSRRAWPPPFFSGTFPRVVGDLIYPSPRKEIFRFGERGRGAARQGCPKRQSVDNLAKPRDVDPFENKFDKHI